MSRPPVENLRPLLKNRWQVSASGPNATTRCHSVRCCLVPLRSVKRSVVASEKFATFCPDGSARTSGSRPRFPTTIALLIDMTLTSNSFRCLISESVFVDPVGVEIAFGLFAVTPTSAVNGLVAGVVERSLAGIDFRLAIRLGTSRRIPDGDPLGIAFEPASHSCFSFRPLPVHRAGRAALCLHSRATFSRGPLNPNWRSQRRFLDARAERAAGRDRAKRLEWAGTACLYGVP